MKLLILIVVCMASYACSHVAINKIDDSHPYTSGVRYFRPAPYIFVTCEDEGKAQWQLIQLPNEGEEYVIRPVVGLGSMTYQLSLDQGWNLTGLGPNTSESGTSSLISALAPLVTALRTNGDPNALVPAACEPKLYPLKFKDGTWSVPKK